MTPVLENNKRLIIKKDKVICKAKITPKDFKNPESESVNSVARFFVYEPEFCGVATLKEGDKDNVRDAIHIAESKMERQYYKFILHFLKYEKSAFESVLPQLDAMIEKNTRNIESITKHILDVVASMD